MQWITATREESSTGELLQDRFRIMGKNKFPYRDIKCENMLMDIDYNIKLSDFGFARGHLKPKNGVIPLSETFCGSYAYASPEILRGVPYQPQLADIWSMGVVLFAMVFGRLPFDDGNYRELIKVNESDFFMNFSLAVLWYSR